MRAVWYTEFGPAAEVLQTGTIETPEPGPGEVRVRLAASGVNPVDVKRRRGARGGLPSSRVIPHFDGAGVVDRVGDGVAEVRIGERAWVFEAQWQRAFGTAAERVVVPADRAVKLPDHTGFAEGACLGIPAMTAHRCVFADGPVSNQTVVITGGAGAVGAYAVQFAKLGGAKVIATISSDEKAAIASTAGADHIVNYKDEDVAARIERFTGGAGADRIIEVEFGGNLATSLAALKPNGVIATYASDAVVEPAVPFYSLVYKNVTVRHVLVFGMPEAAKRHAVADITRWLEADSLRHHVGPRYLLEQTAAAHEAVEAGPLGNVVVEIGDGP